MEINIVYLNIFLGRKIPCFQYRDCLKYQIPNKQCSMQNTYSRTRKPSKRKIAL